ncbi:MULTISPECIES: hypothetical protein [Cyanophyceae]|uniref:hypothetical protein n=1 Tax=Cyanophyceae TaxID=3028117 RepID=UPI0018EF90EF|nr:hypothetical protein [Trichocoleus sp. FACHB-40]
MNTRKVGSLSSSLPLKSQKEIIVQCPVLDAVKGDPVVEKGRLHSVMAKQYSPVCDEVGEFEASATADFLNAATVVAAAGAKPLESDFGFPVKKPTCVRLNMEDLTCFEVVERQFQQWGVTFRNAIALQPSNPAFPVQSGTTVLMGAPKNGLIEVFFEYPVRFVSGFTTSSQRTILSAFDAQDKLLARTEIPGPNLAGTDSPIPPNTLLSVNVPDISRITFYAFDGQLTVDDLSFGF